MGRGFEVEMDFLSKLFRDLTASKSTGQVSATILRHVRKLVPCPRARVAMLARDITGQKKEETTKLGKERLSGEQRARIIHADRIRCLGEMAAGIAHGLAQPLTGVRGVAEHLLIAMDRGWEVEKEKWRDYLDLIIEQADRMVYLIEHVRMFARDAGKVKLLPVEVNEIVRSVEDMMGQQFKAHGLEFIIDLETGLPRVLVNPFSLEEVILNIVTNARNAVEERLKTDSQGDNTIRVCTFLDSKRHQRRVVIVASDHGGGIAKEILLKVDDPLYMIKGRDPGKGLGLSISKSIVEEYGGDLTIESKPGDGTKVTISLPPLSSSEHKGSE